jgi:hypothetical protein
MRALVASAVLAVATAQSARADSFVEAALGAMIPVSDDQWTDYVDSGIKLAARAGTAPAGGGFGALVSVDWTPINDDDDGFGNVDVSAHRFRILIGGTMQRRLGPKLHGSLRLGLGADITYVSIEGSFFGFQIDSSDTDLGLALEPAAGLWFDAGSVQIGGELGLPISLLHDDGDDNDIDLEDYTSVDIDLMFAVRFRQ